jgi:hypothetical protein
VNLRRQIAVNYPDGPKPVAARLAPAAKGPAALRGEASPAGPPPGAAAFTGSGRVDKEIRQGMTPDEVRAVMGEPERDVAFGARRHWTYPGLTVVFDDGRVVEVKF